MWRVVEVIDICWGTFWVEVSRCLERTEDG